MPAIQIETETLELAGSAQVQLERNSPLLSNDGETGEGSLPMKFAKTPTNNRLLGYPGRFDHRAGVPPLNLAAGVLDENNAELATGLLRLRGVEPDGYSYNLELGASAAMRLLKSRQLSQFRFGGPRRLALDAGAVGADSAARATGRFMDAVAANPAGYDFTFAPFSNNDATGTWDKYREIVQGLVGKDQPVAPFVNFNTWGINVDVTGGPAGLGFNTGVRIDVLGPLAAVTTESLFGDTYSGKKVCPLPKLEYVLHQIFRELALPFETDLFDEPELKQLVVVPAAGVVGGAYSGTDFAGSFLIGDHLPDVNAAVFVRQLMNTFGLHFDQTPAGLCRLLRAGKRALEGAAVDLTTATGPAYTLEQQEPTAVVATALLAAGDRYAEEFGPQPEPSDVLATPAATAAQLVAPAGLGPDVFCLVSQERRYYQTVNVTDDTVSPSVTTTQWQRGPFYLPTVRVALTQYLAEESSEEYTPGAAAVLTYPVEVQTFSGTSTADALCFLDNSLGTAAGRRNGSQVLRLAFYRGLQAVGGVDASGAPVRYPWLSQTALDPSGRRIGNYSLEMHGPQGLVAQFLRPLLALRCAKTVVKFPSFLSAREYLALDFSRSVRIQGDEFLLRRASIGLPVQRPGTLELVPRRQVELDAIIAAALNADATGGLSCTLLLLEVERTGNVARVTTSGAQGSLKYQLDAGPLQDSALFTGLVAGRAYTFWVYDQALAGCNRSKTLTW